MPKLESFLKITYSEVLAKSTDWICSTSSNSFSDFPVWRWIITLLFHSFTSCQKSGKTGGKQYPNDGTKAINKAYIYTIDWSIDQASKVSYSL